MRLCWGRVQLLPCLPLLFNVWMIFECGTWHGTDDQSSGDLYKRKEKLYVFITVIEMV